MKSLKEQEVYRAYPLEKLGFTSTGELPILSIKCNQAIPLSALKMGFEIHNRQHIFVCNGSERQSINILQECIRAFGRKPSLRDICFTFNPQNLNSAKLLILPAGTAVKINAELSICISIGYEKLENIITSNEYTGALQDIRDNYHRQINQLIGNFRKKMHAQSIELGHTAKGYILSCSQQEDRDLSRAKKELDEMKVHIAKLERQEYKDIDDFNFTLVSGVINPLLNELRERYADSALEDHFIALVEHICNQLPNMGRKNSSAKIEDWINYYSLNILVEQTSLPVITDMNPSTTSLFGKKPRQMKNQVAQDFQKIRAGNIHRATGGYLILRLNALYQDKDLWREFMQILHEGEYKGHMGVSFPVDFQVLFVGEKDQYCHLMDNDNDFPELPVVLVEFDDELPVSEQNIRWYGQLLASIAVENNLKHLSAAAVVRLLEYSSAYIEEQNRLTLEYDILLEIMVAADYLAKDELVDSFHIEQALREKKERELLAQRNYLQQIERQLVLLQTNGQRVGQINGLAVITSGGVTYGLVCRLSAAVRMGDGDFLDIEREVELGGSLHSKGVLILTNYVGARYSRNRALSIAASLVFEQSYGGVDGDSASLAELCVLLSAIGNFPVKQSIAITGSVNQLGEVQSIGAVNEKIEGFFQVCKLQGFNGEQGVIIPQSNKESLVLDREIRQAISNGEFSVFAVKHVDEALSILTDREAGDEKEGAFPNGSINAQISEQLDQFTQKKSSDKE